MESPFNKSLTLIEQTLNAALLNTLTKDGVNSKESLIYNSLYPDYAKEKLKISSDTLKNIVAPPSYLVSLGGKRWRPLFLLLFYEYVKECFLLTDKTDSKEQDKTLLSLTPLIELTHNASLIHDDIEDKAVLRRGHAACHIKYSLDYALNSASWLYFYAQSFIQTLPINSNKKVKLYEAFTEEVLNLHTGQALDIYWHNNPSILPSIEDYYKMVCLKTASLITLSVRFVLILCSNYLEIQDKAERMVRKSKEEIAAYYLERVRPLCLNIGKAFQILDDVKNLTTGNKGKNKGDDIVEGKKSLPILLHLKEAPADITLINSYFKKAQEEGITSSAISACIELLNKSGSIDKARKEGSTMLEDAVKTLTTIFGNDGSIKSAVAIRKLFSSMIEK